MYINIEITNFSSEQATFDSLKVSQEMTHEEFIEVIKYFELVFQPIITKE